MDKKTKERLNKRVSIIRKDIPDWTLQDELDYINEMAEYDEIDDYIARVGENEILNHIDIDDAIEYYGKSNILCEIDIDDAIEYYGVDRIIEETGVEEVLDTIRFQTTYKLRDYIEERFGAATDYIDTNELNWNTDELKRVLHNFCRAITPRRVLDKETIREIINEFIDENYFNVY